MQILVATVADIDELTSVEIESKRQSLHVIDELSVNPAIRRYRWETYFGGLAPASAKPERIVFKAVVDGKIIGYVAGHLTTRYDKDAEIQNFYLLKQYQRQGIGTELLRHFLTWLHQYPVKSLCVGIDDGNPYQRFYYKHGGAYLNDHWIHWEDIDTIMAVK